MQFRTIERFHESRCRMADVSHSYGFPRNWQQMSNTCPLGHGLPMSARQADRSDLPDVSFFGYFTLANRSRGRDDRSVARITSVSGEVKIVLFHGGLHGEKKIYNPSYGFLNGDFWSVLLGQQATNL
jgi:hypothetical protein